MSRTTRTSQDAELASKDEAIEGLQQQLRQLEQALALQAHSQHLVNGGVSSLADGGSPVAHSRRGSHHQQQQIFHAARGGTLVNGGSSSNGGQGFVAAALARFNSPTKTRAPARQQQQQQQSRAGASSTVAAWARGPS
jgi:hypothetical protein